MYPLEEGHCKHTGGVWDDERDIHRVENETRREGAEGVGRRDDDVTYVRTQLSEMQRRGSKTQLTEDVEGHWHRATEDKQTSGEARTPSLTDNHVSLGTRADIGELGNDGLSARDWESDEQRDKDGEGRD